MKHIQGYSLATGLLKVVKPGTVGGDVKYFNVLGTAVTICATFAIFSAEIIYLFDMTLTINNRNMPKHKLHVGICNAE
jgi:hypothetical protein